MNPKTYIIILNYQTWADTIECLESVLRNDYLNYQIIVIDNNSPNDSMHYIKDWADGKLYVRPEPEKSDNSLRHLSHPPSSKPLPYVFYTKEEAEKGGNKNLELKCKNPLILIQTNYNGGFAFGSNVGIKYALAKDDFEYLWLLNNDTVIERDSLTKLVEKFQEYKKHKKKVGMIGSKVLFYRDPNIINAAGGGTYNKWFGVGKLLGTFQEDKGQYNVSELKIESVYGASCFLRKDFIHEIGIMCEDYFLYYEEEDLAFRGKQKGWQLGYCWQSKVYHKQGLSIDLNSKEEDKSEFADYYWLRNRIVFTKKFFPTYLLSVYLGFIGSIFNRIRRKQYKRIKLIWKILKS